MNQEVHPTNLPCRRAIFSIQGNVAFLTLGLVATAGHAQTALDVGTSGRIVVVPRISVTETFTNNVGLSSTNRQSELITQISPGIRISSQGGRITGTVDYSLSELLYARNSSGRRSENQLNASGKVEVIDKTGYIDFSGVVSQQAISAFGSPTNSAALLNGNSTETAVFRISPNIRGRLGDVAQYDARYSLITSRSGATTTSDVNSSELSLQLGSSGGRAGWTLALNRQTADFSAGRSTESQRIDGQLNFPFTPQWGAFVRVGHESNDFTGGVSRNSDFTALGLNWTPNEELRLSVDQDSRGSTGIVARWTPSKRTSVSVVREQRLYGDTHSIALAYRTPNTAWTFSDSRSAVTNPGQITGAAAPSLYDILFGQFITVEPDPIKRDQYDSFLRANGIVPNATAVGGFLTSSLSLQRQQQLSFALFGARSTLSIIGTRSSNSRLNSGATGPDDFATAGVVSQNGLSANYSYRLTARSLLSVIAARQSSSGSLGVAGTSSRSMNVNLSSSLTRDTSASISARRVVFDSATAPYTETAVTGSLSVQF